jgi:hypothetical protein
MSFKVFKDTFKGHDIFAVWETDDSGNKVGKYPAVSFGRKKAQMLVQFITELQAFAKEEKKE